MKRTLRNSNSNWSKIAYDEIPDIVHLVKFLPDLKFVAGKEFNNILTTADGDLSAHISSADVPTGLPGSQLGAGILSDKSFAALGSLVSEASLKVPLRY